MSVIIIHLEIFKLVEFLNKQTIYTHTYNHM